MWQRFIKHAQRIEKSTLQIPYRAQYRFRVFLLYNPEEKKKKTPFKTRIHWLPNKKLIHFQLHLSVGKQPNIWMDAN